MNTKSQGAFIIGLGLIVFLFTAFVSLSEEDFEQSDAIVVCIVTGLFLFVVGAMVRLKGIHEEVKPSGGDRDG